MASTPSCEAVPGVVSCSSQTTNSGAGFPNVAGHCWLRRVDQEIWSRLKACELLMDWRLFAAFYHKIFAEGKILYR